jgi:RNA recognition motif-containing protein
MSQVEDREESLHHGRRSSRSRSRSSSTLSKNKGTNANEKESVLKSTSHEISNEKLKQSSTSSTEADGSQGGSIFVTNLSRYVTSSLSAPNVSLLVSRNVKNDHLQEIFGYYGNIRGIDLKTDKKTHLSKGEATITFSTEKDAEHALFHLDGGQIDGNIIKCSFVLINPSSSSFSTEKISFPQKSVPVFGGDGEIGRGEKSKNQEERGEKDQNMNDNAIIRDRLNSKDERVNKGPVKDGREDSNRQSTSETTKYKEKEDHIGEQRKGVNDITDNKSKEMISNTKGMGSRDDRDDRRSSRDRGQTYQPPVNRVRSRSNPRATTGRGSGRGRFPTSSRYGFDVAFCSVLFCFHFLSLS